MKKLISLIVCGMCCLGAWAQGSIPLLDKVQGHRVTFHYTYSLAKNGADFSPVTDGDVTLEGNAYILEGLGLEVGREGAQPAGGRGVSVGPAGYGAGLWSQP